MIDTTILEWKAIKQDISRLAFKDSWTRQDSMDLQDLLEEESELNVYLINKGFTIYPNNIVTPQGITVNYENV